MNWKDQLEKLKTAEVVSAGKALDFLDGLQAKYLIAALTSEEGGIKDWKKRGVKPLTDNITAKIIERSALSYQQEPERIVMTGEDSANDAGSEVYRDLLGKYGTTSIQAVDHISRLLKVCLCLVQYIEDTGKLDYSVLHRGNCDVDWNPKTKQIDSLLYTAGGVGPTGGKMYHHWTAEAVQDIEEKDGRVEVFPAVPHPYGIVPVAWMYDSKPPRYGFWPAAEWDEVITLNEALNMFQTNCGHASNYQVFPTLFTNAEIKDGQVIGIDAVVQIVTPPGDVPAYLEFKSPDVNLDEFIKWIEWYAADIADSWGVNIKVSGQGAADSGFKLIVEETWNLEGRKKRLRTAEWFEEGLYQVVLTVSDAHGLKLPAGSTINIDFADPALAVDTEAKNESDRKDFAVRLKTARQIWHERNPDLTEKQLDEMEAENKPKVPDFSGVVEGN